MLGMDSFIASLQPMRWIKSLAGVPAPARGAHILLPAIPVNHCASAFFGQPISVLLFDFATAVDASNIGTLGSLAVAFSPGGIFLRLGQPYCATNRAAYLFGGKLRYGGPGKWSARRFSRLRSYKSQHLVVRSRLGERRGACSSLSRSRLGTPVTMRMTSR